MILSRLSSLDLAFIARNTSLMLKAGIPISEALGFVEGQSANLSVKKIMRDVKEKVEGGMTVARAMEMHTRTFGPLFIQFVRIGEESGNLEKTLLYLATQDEREQDTKKKIRSALIYPVIIMLIAVVYALVFAFVIFPRLTALFSDFGSELPTLTRIIIDLVSWLRSWGFIVVIGVIVIAFLLAAFRRTPGISHVLDRVSLIVPGVRKVTREYLFARFFHTLGYLVKSGIPLTESLDVAQHASFHSVMQKHIQTVRIHIEEGKTFSEGMEQTKFFPPLAQKLIFAAEKSGSLEDTLSYLGAFYERNIDYTTKNLTTSVEPILLILVGIAVALLAIAIILPIYQFTGAISIL